MRSIFFILTTLFFLTGCSSHTGGERQLAQKILNDKSFPLIQQKARQLLSGSFSAGAGYGQVWIRDFTTFMELALEVNDPDTVREKLLMFFKFQGDDGNIVDGYAHVSGENRDAPDFIFSSLAPGYAAHKNTVETDQETSLIQGVYQYIRKTGDKAFLDVQIDTLTVARRMERALEYLFHHRFSKKYGLITGATTADWGDVQPEGGWGVDISDSTHWAIDIYDNAMLVIALKDYLEMVPSKKKKWVPVLERTVKNIRKYLWDEENEKYIPHLYLNGSPFPPDFDENKIYYHGGTTVAIEAGLLSREEVKKVLDRMVADMKAAGAATIGLTMYPAYPEGYFKNPILTKPYTYQNGGDWTWFGGRMIQQLVRYGFVKEAYEQVQPFNERVIRNNDFYEWYTLTNEPRGSAAFKGSAGVLYVALSMLEDWAKEVMK